MELDGWYVQFFGALAAVLATVLTYGVNKLISYVISKMEADETQKQAFDALAAGMAEAQNEVVRKIKTASEDGKLSIEEIKEIEAYALERAKTIATGDAKNLVISWTSQQASSYIKQLLAKFSK